MILKARWILPVTSPPLQDGAVEIEGNKIKGVTSQVKTGHQDEVVPLGEMILLPGLVNAHCHLEFSALKGILKPKQPFTLWIKELSAEFQGLTPLDREEGWEEGIRQLLQGGTTTLANHITIDPLRPPSRTLFPEGSEDYSLDVSNLPEPSKNLSEEPKGNRARRGRLLRTIHFLEVIGAGETRARESLEVAHALQQKLPESFVTPHSLYSVHLEVLEEMFGEKTPLQSIHLLESADEDQFFREQRGPLANFVQERGGDLSFPLSSPVKWLAAFLMSHRNVPPPLLIHGNYLQPAEIALLREARTSVIHSPGSHRFFGHRSFPLRELRKGGVPLGLGTDSLASNDEINMLREMALLKEEFPELEAKEILWMATMGGAKGLGMEKKIGSLEKGKVADLVGLKIRRPFTNPYELVLHAHAADWVMIDGKICTPR